MNGAALITAARAATALREQIAPDARVEYVGAMLCEDGGTIMLTLEISTGATITRLVPLADLGGTATADFARHIEVALQHPRRPTLRLSSRGGGCAA